MFAWLDSCGTPKPRTLYPETYTRNPKPETEAPKAEIRNPTLQTRDPKPLL